MQARNEYLATAPFDLYELSLFHLVVKHRSFTGAAAAAGLGQSAITRQIQGMENSLGLDLLERTTRSVRLTPAGQDLFEASRQILGAVEATLQRLREDHGQARKQVRLGVSSSIALAYLPGFLHANLRCRPQIGCQVCTLGGEALLAAVLANDVDVGVLAARKGLPKALQVTHRFNDVFTLITPAACAVPTLDRRKLATWAAGQDWLLLRDDAGTGGALRRWMRRQGWKVEPTMELESFDWIINLVSLGLGVGLVPTRALGLYPQKKTVQRVVLRERFEREIVVLVRRSRKLPDHLKQFIDNILF